MSFTGSLASFKKWKYVSTAYEKVAVSIFIFHPLIIMFAEFEEMKKGVR